MFEPKWLSIRRDGNFKIQISKGKYESGEIATLIDLLKKFRIKIQTKYDHHLEKTRHWASPMSLISNMCIAAGFLIGGILVTWNKLDDRLTETIYNQFGLENLQEWISAQNIVLDLNATAPLPFTLINRD